MTSSTTYLGSRRQIRRAQQASRKRHPAVRKVVRTAPLPITYYVIAIVIATLVPLGLVMVLSASSITQLQADNSPWHYFRRQALWAAAGFVALNIAMRIKLRTVRRLSTLALLGAFALMLLPFFPSVGVTVHGARAWVAVGPIVFQPSEFLKLAVLLVCAKLLTGRYDKMGDLRATMWPCVMIVGAGAALMLAQGDLGSAIVLGAIGISVLFLAGTPLVPLAGMAGALAASGFAFAFSTPYRRARWTAFLNIAKNREGDSYQTWQSLLSIANGGFTGRGVGAGTGKWGYVPLAHSDFIFAVLAEELGFLGVFAVLGAFAVLTWAGMQAALGVGSSDRFAMLMAGGIVTWIGLQAAINVAGVVGLLPVTGLTLPFLSYGGSSLLVSMTAGGLLLNVARQSP
jgi:cell division protein FtsW